MGFLDQVYVEECFKQEALEKLQERISRGETAKGILKIDNDYYCDKVVNGLVPMSYDIYNRIMGCSVEDSYD